METPGSSYLSQVWYILAITFCTVIRTTTLAGSFNLGAVTGTLSYFCFKSRSNTGITCFL